MLTTHPIRFVLAIGCIAASLAIIQPTRAADRQDDFLLSRPIAPLPRAVTSFGAAVDGNWLYVIGGHAGERHKYSAETYNTPFRRLNLLDRLTWEELPGGIALQSVALTAGDGALYRVGGATARNAVGEENDMVSVADVRRFDVATREWSDLPPLPQPRSSHDAVVFEKTLYVIGGWILGGKDSEPVWHDSALALDLSDKDATWRELPTPPFSRRAVGLAALDGNLYVIGGMTPEGETTTRVDVFDTRANEWTRGPDYPKGEFHAIMACSTLDAVYASGLDGVVNRLTPGAREWMPAYSLAFPRFFHRLVTANSGELLALGGASRDGKLTNIETVALDPRGGTVTRIEPWTIPSEAPAKNRQGLFVVGQRLVVFGGNNSTEQHDFEADNFVNDARIIQPGAHRVDAAAPFPVARQSMQTIVVGEEETQRGIALGGFGWDGSIARSHVETYRYNFHDDKWRSGPDLPRPMTQFGVAEYDDTLWMFGGLDYDPSREKDAQFEHLDTVLTWELAAPEDRVVATEYHLPQPRRAFGGDQLGAKYYLVGGMREGFSVIETCDVFDFDSKKWSTIPAPSRARISPELVALNGKLYLSGGSSPDGDGGFGPNASVEVFDPAANRWATLVAELPFDTRQMRMVAFGDRLLAYSAQATRSPSVSMWLITLGAVASGDVLVSGGDGEPESVR